jgi:hypothetical protein
MFYSPPPKSKKEKLDRPIGKTIFGIQRTIAPNKPYGGG